MNFETKVVLSQKITAMTLALLSVALLVILCKFYPMAVTVCLGIVVSFSLIAWISPYAGFVSVLACLPWLSFTKWTGAMVVEEIDFAILGTVLGVALHKLFHSFQAVNLDAVRMSLPVKLLFTAAWLILGWSCWQGYSLLPQPVSVFFTNYEDQAGAIRTAKAALLAILLFKACKLASGDIQKLTDSLVLGMCFGLVVAVCGTVFERWYFTGISDLSSDYRTTAWFWEMHTGGATLDAYLAASAPFLFLALKRWRHWLAQVLLLTLTLVLVYSAVTTFSRGVYLALPVAALICMFLMRRQQSFISNSVKTKQKLLMLLLVAGGVIATSVAFSTGGYRAIVAVQGAMAAVLVLCTHIKRIKSFQLFISIAVSLMFLPVLLLSVELAKGPYILFGILWVFAVVGLYRLSKYPTIAVVNILTVCCILLLCFQAAIISWYWDDMQSKMLPLVVASVLFSLFFFSVFARHSMPDLVEAKRYLFKMWLIGAACSIVIAMFFASSFISSRFATADRDLDGRFDHWRNVVNVMPDRQSLLTGAGVGRFVSLNRQFGELHERVAEFSLLPLVQGQNILHIKSGSHQHGYGEMLRLTQQIDSPKGDVQLSISLRHAGLVRLLFEICDKQLLYHGRCARLPVEISVAEADKLQDKQLTLLFKNDVFEHSLYNRMIDKTFSMAVSSADLETLISEVSLRDANGRELLKNGDFSNGFKYWFFTSDKHHMPYHVKGLFPLQFFEQGAAGLLLWSVITAVVIFRACCGKATRQPLSYAVAGALCGILVIGMFDSVIDSARLAFLYFLLLLVGSAVQDTEETSATKPVTQY